MMLAPLIILLGFIFSFSAYCAVQTQFLLQTWSFVENKNTTANSNFRLRRAEIKFSAEIPSVNKAKAFVMLDPTKSLSTGSIQATQDNKIIQDLGIQIPLGENMEIVFGQFKTLSSAEGLLSSASLLLPERSLVGRTFGDRRQTGIKANWSTSFVKLGMMVANTGKSNTSDQNTAKDLFLRMDVPLSAQLCLGTHLGAENANFSQHQQWGVNLHWKGDKEIFQLEHGSRDPSWDGQTPRSYGQVFTGAYQMTELWQGVYRWERLKVKRTSPLTSSGHTLGVNYLLPYPSFPMKIQLAHSFLKNMTSTQGTYHIANRAISNLQLTLLNVQVDI